MNGKRLLALKITIGSLFMSSQNLNQRQGSF